MSNINRLESEQSAMASATKDIRSFLNKLLDEQSFVEMNAFVVGKDRLGGQPILGEGVLCGTATVQNCPVVVIAQNVQALYGSFGKAQADKICRAFDLAISRSIPVISILDSAGARVGEGVEVLEGYGAVLAKAVQFADSGLHICIVKGQAVGMMASFAMLADYRFALQSAVLSPIAPAVLSATLGNADAAKAENLAAEGYVDFVCDSEEDCAYTFNSLCAWVFGDMHSNDDPNRESPALADDCSIDNLLDSLVDDGIALEYQPLRQGGVRCFYAQVAGMRVGVTVCCGKLSENDCGKIDCFADTVDCAGAALVTLIDSEGIEDADVGALADGMTYLTRVLCKMQQPKVAVCVGNAIGSAYTLLASKSMGVDYSIAFADAVISPIAPTAAVHLVYADVLKEKGVSAEVQAELAEMYRTEHCDAFAAAAKGYIDEVIDPATLRPYVANALIMLGAKE